MRQESLPSQSKMKASTLLMSSFLSSNVALFAAVIQQKFRDGYIGNSQKRMLAESKAHESGYSRAPYMQLFREWPTMAVASIGCSAGSHEALLSAFT